MNEKQRERYENWPAKYKGASHDHIRRNTVTPSSKEKKEMGKSVTNTKIMRTHSRQFETTPFKRHIETSTNQWN